MDDGTRDGEATTVRIARRGALRSIDCRFARNGAVSLFLVGVLYGCSGPGPDADPAQSDTLPLNRTSVSLHEDVFVAAAGTVIDFLRGDAEFDALNLSDTVSFYLAPEGGGATAEVSASDLRDRTRWRVRSDSGQTYVLAPPDGSLRLTSRFGRHMKCFEYALGDDFPDLARLPHVGTRLEPENMTSCLQTWNLTLVFQADARPPRLAAVVYDQWEW